MNYIKLFGIVVWNSNSGTFQVFNLWHYIFFILIKLNLAIIGLGLERVCELCRVGKRCTRLKRISFMYSPIIPNFSSIIFLTKSSVSRLLWRWDWTFLWFPFSYRPLVWYFGTYICSISFLSFCPSSLSCVCCVHKFATLGFNFW